MKIDGYEDYPMVKLLLSFKILAEYNTTGQDLSRRSCTPSIVATDKKLTYELETVFLFAWGCMCRCAWENEFINHPITMAAIYSSSFYFLGGFQIWKLKLWMLLDQGGYALYSLSCFQVLRNQLRGHISVQRDQPQACIRYRTKFYTEIRKKIQN